MAAATGACVLLVRRPTKARQASALQRGAGPPAWLEVCWTALLAGRDPGVPERHVLALTQSRGGPMPPSRRWSVLPHGPAAAVRWHEECLWEADEVAATAPEQRADRLSRVEDCAEYIRVVLHGTTMPTLQLHSMCQMNDFADTTIRRARKYLGVKAVRTDLCRWELSLPANAAKPQLWRKS
jgi:hypothetical protein